MPRPRHVMLQEMPGSGSRYNVLRFWDNEVFQNLEGILEVVRKNVASTLSP